VYRYPTGEWLIHPASVAGTGQRFRWGASELGDAVHEY